MTDTRQRRRSLTFQEFEKCFMDLYKADNFNRIPSTIQIQREIGGSYTTLMKFHTEMLDKLNNEILDKHEMMLSTQKKAELENMISMFISKAYEFVSQEAANKVDSMANIFTELKKEKELLSEQLAEKETSIETLKGFNDELIATNAKIKDEKEEIFKNYGELIKSHKEEKEELKAELLKTKEEKEELKSELLKYKEESELLNAELNKLKAELEELKQATKPRTKNKKNIEETKQDV